MEINKTRTITSFISSANRQLQEQSYNFTIDYPDGILSCRPNEYMKLMCYLLICLILCITLIAKTTNLT